MSEKDYRLSVTSTCNDCGEAITVRADTMADAFARIDPAHDLIRPDCPQAVERKPVSS